MYNSKYMAAGRKLLKYLVSLSKPLRFLLALIVLSTCLATGSAFAATGLDDYVVLLLHGNPGDNIVTTLRDSSFASTTPVLNGNATSTSDKFSQSGFFDGSGDYLVSSDHADYEMGTGDFTIDVWFFPANTSGGFRNIIEKPSGYGGYAPYAITQSGTSLLVALSSSGSSWDVANRTITNALTANTWTHIALVRQGTTFRVFINGAQADTWTSSASLYDNSGSFYVGTHAATSNWLNGQIDELRVSKGIARWTSNFTPPTAPYTSDGNTSLLLHADGTSGSTTFTDSSGNPKTMTANGNAVISSLTKLGNSGIYFDGSGDYINIPITSGFQPGTGDFTLDTWIRINGDSGYNTIMELGTYTNGILFRYTANALDTYINGTNHTSSWAWTKNTWYHLALVRSGTSLKTYVNGVQLGSFTNSANITGGGSSNVRFGESIHTSGHGLNGSLDEIRFSKGIARWTADFTPPTAEYGLEGITFTGAVKFLKNIAVIGSISKGAGTFVIDHPQKPSTHLLFHSFLESSDAKNLYDGVAELDEIGEAIIQLPDYFEALNKDFRYQYFPIDEAMPGLYATEVENNQFTLAGGKPGGRVSWQITGIRHDAYIEANPISVEVNKGPGELVNKGECLFEPACQ